MKQLSERLHRVYGVIDCHTHSGAVDINNYYKVKYPAMQDVSTLINIMDSYSVDFAITFPMPSTLYYNVRDYWNHGVFKSSDMCEFPFIIENEYLLAEVQYFRAKSILPFLAFSVNDKVSEQCRYLYRVYSEHNIYGLKYHSKADQNSFSDLVRKAPEIIELMLELNIPIVFHSETLGVSSPMEVFRVVERYPDLRINLAHYAGMNAAFYREYDEYIKTHKNIFLDTAPSICMCRRFAQYAVKEELLDLDYNDSISVNQYFLEKYGDFVLWGTDTPWHFSDNLKQKSEKPIGYKDELELRQSLTRLGFEYKDETVNRFLFG